MRKWMIAALLVGILLLSGCVGNANFEDATKVSGTSCCMFI